MQWPELLQPLAQEERVDLGVLHSTVKTESLSLQWSAEPRPSPVPPPHFSVGVRKESVLF